MKKIFKFPEVYLGDAMSDSEKTGLMVLSWVSVCSEVAEDWNTHSLVREYERLYELELHMSEAAREGKSRG